MAKKAGNTDNLRPVRTKAEARERGRNGGIASGIARANKKTSRQIVEMLDSLPVTGGNKEALKSLGIPHNDLTQLTLRLVALHKKALSGDTAANELILKIKGEAPTQTLNIEMGDETRAAYDRAADAIRDRGK